MVPALSIIITTSSESHTEKAHLNKTIKYYRLWSEVNCTIRQMNGMRCFITMHLYCMCWVITHIKCNCIVCVESSLTSGQRSLKYTAQIMFAPISNLAFQLWQANRSVRLAWWMKRPRIPNNTITSFNTWRFWPVTGFVHTLHMHWLTHSNNTCSLAVIGLNISSMMKTTKSHNKINNIEVYILC